MKEEKIFWELLRAGLWNKAPLPLATPLTEQQWEEIYQLAKIQTVEGLVYDGMMQLPMEQQPSEMFRLKWYGRVNRYEQNHKVIDRVLVDYVTKLEEAGIRSMLLKGQGIASFYVNPLRRQCGDIDLYVGRENYQRACELSAQWGMNIANENTKHLHVGKDGVNIDLHRVTALFPSSEKDRQFIGWSEQMLRETQSSFIPATEKKAVRMAEPTFNVFFVFYHLFFHFMHGGIGVRHLCDLARMLHVLRDEIDKAALEKQLQYYGVMQPWQVMGHVLVHQLGLPQEELPFYQEEGKKAAMTLQLIMEGGNFGRTRKKRQKRIFTSYVLRKLERLWYRTLIYVQQMRIFPSLGWEHYMFTIRIGLRKVKKDLKIKL